MTRVVVGKRKEDELKRIKSGTIDMFNQIEKMLELAKILLETSDNSLALQVIEEDKYTDDLQNDMIVEITNFILIEQPKAIDLRVVLGTLQLVGDLERIGDYCKSFAKTMIKSDIEERKHQKLVEKILGKLLKRVGETKVAYQTLDHPLAKNIAKRDEEIDELTSDLTKDVNKQLEETSDPNEIKAFTRIILLAKTFERSGDHIVNICEQISYINKGQIYHYS